MRFLSILSRRVAIGFCRQIARIKMRFYILAARVDGVVTQIGGVGSHIRNMARLIQSLSQSHRLLDRKTQSR